MKKYLVYEEWYNDMDGGRDFHLFDNLETAKRFFEYTIEASVSELYGSDRDMVVEKNDIFYEIYEDGYYLANHYTAMIQELEVEV